MKFERKTLPQKTYIYSEHTVAISGPEIAQAMGTGFGELFMLLQKQGLRRSLPLWPFIPRCHQIIK